MIFVCWSLFLCRFLTFSLIFNHCYFHFPVVDYFTCNLVLVVDRWSLLNFKRIIWSRESTPTRNLNAMHHLYGLAGWFTQQICHLVKYLNRTSAWFRSDHNGKSIYTLIYVVVVVAVQCLQWLCLSCAESVLRYILFVWKSTVDCFNEFTFIHAHGSFSLLLLLFSPFSFAASFTDL